jgi:hypothetical protein
MKRAAQAIYGITTDELAAQLGIRSTSIRSRVCRFGSYFGIEPTKLPNGRLLWPADALHRLTSAGGR